MPGEQEIEGQPTEYKGIVFRSQLEAQWAVFFDALHETWEYEPSRLRVERNLWYLPDFWFPKHEKWVEITPRIDLSGSVEERQAVGLFRLTGKPVYVLSGLPDVMPVRDLFDTNASTVEICKFSMHLVDEKSPDQLTQSTLVSETADMMELLGLVNDNTTEKDYRDASMRFVEAATRARNYFDGQQRPGALQNWMQKMAAELRKVGIQDKTKV